jgi:hypothetical protein
MAQFEAWMRVNQCAELGDSWVKSDLLGLALEGEAQNLYSGLNEDDRRDYEVLKKKLEMRYGATAAETFKAKFLGARKRLPDEGISKLRDALWMTARKAYPGLSNEAQEQIALDALLRSVETDLRVQCTMHECKTLDSAVDVMQKFEAVTQGDGKTKAVRMVGTGDPDDGKTVHGLQEEAIGLQEVCDKLTTMIDQQKQVLKEVRKSPNWKPRAGSPGCYRCGEKSHFIRDCPMNQQNGSFGSGNVTPPANSQ